MATYTGAATYSLIGGITNGAGPSIEPLSPCLMAEPTYDGGTYDQVDHLARTPKSHTTALADDFIQYGSEWFEKVIVNPNSHELGNILSDQTISIEIFPTYRKDKQTFSSFVNNAGDGISLSGVSLPYQLELFEDLMATLNVSTTGPASVDSTIEYVFSGETVVVPISLKRILLFPIPPELPFNERLEWRTDVILNADGSEQRIAAREHPRQLFDWTFRMTDDVERRKIESLIIDFMGRTFGIPMWHEGMTLSSAVTAGDSVLNVVSTDYTDLRDGGLVLIYQDMDTFDVLTVTSSTATTITCDSEAANSYGLDAVVYPLRTAQVEGDIKGQQYPVNVLDLNITFRTTDNVADLADASGYSTYKNRSVVDGCNVVDGTMSVGYSRERTIFDPITGTTSENVQDRVARHRRTKGFRATGKQGLWAVRQLLWALRGRQVAFYMPTDLPEFTVVQDIAVSTDGLQVAATNYAKHVRAEGPYNVIRITKTDGTEIIRTVTAATDNGDGTESWTVDAVWDSDILAADIGKVDILEKVRFDTDNITIEHLPGGYVKRIGAPVIGVID